MNNVLVSKSILTKCSKFKETYMIGFIVIILKKKILKILKSETKPLNLFYLNSNLPGYKVKIYCLKKIVQGEPLTNSIKLYIFTAYLKYTSISIKMVAVKENL